MKKFKTLVTRILPAVVGCLTLVLMINANSSSCYFINQPKEPKAIERFKKFK